MNHSTIIEKFYKGELKPNQTFVRYVDNGPDPRYAYLEMRVSEDGDELRSSWYDPNRTFIFNSRAYKRNDTSEGFDLNEVDPDWHTSGYDNVLDKKTI